MDVGVKHVCAPAYRLKHAKIKLCSLALKVLKDNN